MFTFWAVKLNIKDFRVIVADGLKVLSCRNKIQIYKSLCLVLIVQKLFISYLFPAPFEMENVINYGRIFTKLYNIVPKGV